MKKCFTEFKIMVQTVTSFCEVLTYSVNQAVLTHINLCLLLSVWRRSIEILPSDSLVHELDTGRHKENYTLKSRFEVSVEVSVFL